MHAGQGRLLSLAPGHRGPVRPRLAASPNSPLPTTQNALSKDASLHTRAQRIQAEAKVDGNARPAPSLCGAHENRSPGSVSLSPEKNKGVDMCVQANERALSVGRFSSVLISSSQALWEATAIPLPPIRERGQER